GSFAMKGAEGVIFCTDMTGPLEKHWCYRYISPWRLIKIAGFSSHTLIVSLGHLCLAIDLKPFRALCNATQIG
ncbi:MAG: hypothetical protein MZV70_62415, partial [Desulfobacterales bacterium]|nr:hypothetical protein [Desulfobacterales bacterium]